MNILVYPTISADGRRRMMRSKMAHYLASLLAFGVLVYVAFLLGDGAEPENRILLLRYWMLLGAAVSAVAVPHVLLPDRRVPLMQLVNGDPGGLQILQAVTWMVIPLGFMLSAVVVAFFDPGGFGSAIDLKLYHLLECLLLLLGIGAYSLSYYTSLGAISQRWQEGESGAVYQKLREHSPQATMGVPDGLVPAITATARIFAIAIVVIGVGGMLSAEFGAMWAAVPAAVLCIYSGIRMAHQRSAYDRDFYQTSAFYREVLRDDRTIQGGGQEPIQYDAVYWTPGRWRAHVWASLRQLDRRLPLGRLMLLGHLLLWILFFQGAELATTSGYLLLFITAKNAACFILTQADVAPPGFQWSMQPPKDWALTRFFVNLRWTFPMLLSLVIVALFSARFSLGDALFWTGIDVLVAALAAVLLTYFTEGRHRSQFQ